MSHIVTPKIKKELSVFAERITPKDAAAGTSVPGKGLTGAELASQYGITTDSKGRALEPGRRYFTTDLPRVNHLRRLCKAFEAGAWPQVELYLKPFRTPAAAARDAAAAAAAQVPAPVAPALELAAAGAPGYGNAVATGPAEVFINGNKVEGITEVRYSPATFRPLPEVMAEALATEVQVSTPYAEREFFKMGKRWEDEADAAQQLGTGGRAAGMSYARRNLVHTGTITLEPEEAEALRALAAEVQAYPPDAGAQHWFDEFSQLPQPVCPLEAGAHSCHCHSSSAA